MRSLSIRSGWFSLVLALPLAACGGGHDDLGKKLSAMQTELTQVQQHNQRLEERLQALEVRKEAPVPRSTSADSGGAGERPRLMVVKLEPGAENNEPAMVQSNDAPTAAIRPEDSAADTSPRPMIRLYGSRSDGDSSSSRKRSGN